MLYFRTEKLIYDSFQTERSMIVVTVFILIINQTNFSLVYNKKKNCCFDRISVNLVTVFLYTLQGVK